MLTKCLILHGKRRTDRPSLFACQCNECGNVFFIKEEIILVDMHFVTFLRQSFTRCQLPLAGCIRCQQVSLMKPQGIVLNPQIPRTLIKRRNTTLILKDDLEHISNNYSTKMQKQGQSFLVLHTCGVYKFVG